MSDYVSLFKEFNHLAKENFEKYQKAEKKLLEAKERADLWPKGSGYNADTKAKALRAQADYEEAYQEHKEALRTFKESVSDFAPIGERLRSALEDEYRIRPEKVDLATLELMKAGVMKGSDYKYLMEDARKNNNYTMMRLIGKYADEAANAYDPTSIDARDLRYLGVEGSNLNGSEYLDSFKVMTDTYKRCTENTALINHWDEFFNFD